MSLSQRLACAVAMAAMTGSAGSSGGDAQAGRVLYRAQCAGCHAADGSGGREGGVSVPAIDWATLARPRIIAPARPAYDEGEVVRVVAFGIDPGGRVLAPAMPRVALTTVQQDSLAAYIAIIGTARDPEPGVGPAEIRIGAVLPISGNDAATGRTVQAAVTAAFAAAGPIFGRTLRLDVEDAGGDVAAATARMAHRDRVLALVATLVPKSIDVEMPVVGPLDLSVIAGRGDRLGSAAAATLIEALERVGARPTRALLAGALKTPRDGRAGGSE